MTSVIQYIELGDQTYDLFSHPILRHYGQQIIDEYAEYNTDGNNILSVTNEIFPSIEARSRERVERKFAAYAILFWQAKQVPVVRLSYERYHDQLDGPIRSRILTQPLSFDLHATSTAEGDRRFDQQEQEQLNIAEQKRGIDDANNFAARYTAIWGVTQDDYDQSLQTSLFFYIDNPLVLSSIDTESFLMPENIVQFVDAEGKVKVERYLYEDHTKQNMDPISLIFSSSRLHHATAFIEHYRQDIAQASAIMHRHHPDIHAENFAALLAWVFVLELLLLQGEDPLQDIGACLSAGCAVKNEFRHQFDLKYTKGWGSWAIWNLASRIGNIFGPYGKKNQGYGPGQVILELALEAGKETELLESYSPYLESTDFESKQSALEAIFDPTKMVYVKALTQDYVLKKLKEEVADPADATLAIDGLCSFDDPAIARELFLITNIQTFVAFPERDTRYISAHTGLFNRLAELDWIGRLTGFPTHFPGITYKKRSTLVPLSPIEQYNHGIFEGDPNRLLELDPISADSVKLVPAVEIKVSCDSVDR